jgi:hypothetical protein
VQVGRHHKFYLVPAAQVDALAALDGARGEGAVGEARQEVEAHLGADHHGGGVELQNVLDQACSGRGAAGRGRGVETTKKTASEGWREAAVRRTTRSAGVRAGPALELDPKKN